MKARFVSATVLWALACTSVYAKGEAERGRDVFAADCIACHAMACDRGGPRLSGVIGRKAASLDEFPYYTKALKASGVTWTVDALDRFLADPTAVVPGTSMWAGKIEDSARRQDVIAFLREGDTSLDLCN